MSLIALAINGGAEPAPPFIRDHETQYMQSLSSIAENGHTTLRRGCTAPGAVTEAACLPENNALFNAGNLCLILF
jgi:isoaspartyl peptidase/L-asparaginase-like protein (Ntn-hydrolase superfamily)